MGDIGRPSKNYRLGVVFPVALNSRPKPIWFEIDTQREPEPGYKLININPWLQNTPYKPNKNFVPAYIYVRGNTLRAGIITILSS